jgi:Family of unknown function (DUF5752)
MKHDEPFNFYTERRLVALTGLKATTLEQLLQGIRDVPGSSIFYHTHHEYLSHHFETPVYTNNFAMWVSEALQEERLSEKLAAIDLLAFPSIRQLRETFVWTIESDLEAHPRPARICPPGDEFHFCRSKSFIMTTGLTAADPAEFFAVLPHVTNVSLFYHFFEARLRLERPTNDFSQWLGWRGESKLAAAIDKLDPYAMTLDELRDRIVDLGTRGEA